MKQTGEKSPDARKPQTGLYRQIEALLTNVENSVIINMISCAKGAEIKKRRAFTGLPLSVSGLFPAGKGAERETNK